VPIERSRYPRCWNKLSLAYRALRDWRCEHCHVLCRKPGESLDAFCQRSDRPTAEIQQHPKRFCLTTAHLDQDPGKNRLSNLRALCTVCHLQYDARFYQFNRYAKRERRGQLNLSSIALVDPAPAGHGKDLSRIQPGIPILQPLTPNI
jgi:5-methylcytosine-specific restriction endonuclease McrA